MRFISDDEIYLKRQHDYLRPAARLALRLAMRLAVRLAMSLAVRLAICASRIFSTGSASGTPSSNAPGIAYGSMCVWQYVRPAFSIFHVRPAVILQKCISTNMCGQKQSVKQASGSYIFQFSSTASSNNS